MTYRSNLLPKLRDINVGTGMNEVSKPCDKKVNCNTGIKMDLHYSSINIFIKNRVE